ncbi:hypothetical protein GGS21DRAFT_492291 [Xylaria nigripes]|nr:hypothetical protein GGS21DRAFT_492291 [Xylaria nigripes]
MAPLAFLGHPLLSHALMAPTNSSISMMAPMNGSLSTGKTLRSLRCLRPKRCAMNFLKHMLGFANHEAPGQDCGQKLLASPALPLLGETSGPVNERIHTELYADDGFDEIRSDGDELMDLDTTLTTESDWDFVDHATISSECVQDENGDGDGDEQLWTIGAHIESTPRSSFKVNAWFEEEELKYDSTFPFKSRVISDDSDQDSEYDPTSSLNISADSEIAVSLDDNHSIRTVLPSYSDSVRHMLSSSADAVLVAKPGQKQHLSAGLTRTTGAGIFMPPPMNDEPQVCDDAGLMADSVCDIPST